MTARRFENLDCPVEVGEPCVMPRVRKWEWSLPSLLSVLALLGLWFGSLITYVVINDRRATKTDGEVEVLKLADKGITEHATYTEQAAIRDRAEMREDIKEIKRLLIQGRGR